MRGSRSRSQRSLAPVKEATITLPTSRAQACGPPSSSTSRSAWGAAEVSFHSIARRTGSPRSSTATMPCCWPATATASARSISPEAARPSARSHSRGSTWVPAGWSARP